MKQRLINTKLIEIPNLSSTDVKDILECLLIDETAGFHSEIDKLDKRIGEHCYFFIQIGYFNPFYGDDNENA
jgi:hypothetical protein